MEKVAESDGKANAVIEVVSFGGLTFLFKNGVDVMQYLLDSVFGDATEAVGNAWDYLTEPIIAILGLKEDEAGVQETVYKKTILPQNMVDRIQAEALVEIKNELETQLASLISLKLNILTMRESLYAERQALYDRIDELLLRISNRREEIFTLKQSLPESPTYVVYTFEMDVGVPPDTQKRAFHVPVQLFDNKPEWTLYEAYGDTIISYPIDTDAFHQKLYEAYEFHMHRYNLWVAENELVFNQIAEHEAAIVVANTELELTNGNLIPNKQLEITNADTALQDILSSIDAVEADLATPTNLLNESQIKKIEIKIDLAEWAFAAAMAGTVRWYLKGRTRTGF